MKKNITNEKYILINIYTKIDKPHTYAYVCVYVCATWPTLA